MKKVKLILAIVGVTTLFTLTSCKKCHECHYDKAGQEIELGEYCEESEINDLETNGYTVDSVNYVVHCHEH
ncbi:MAG: hypothetical protein ACK5B9_16145 [Flavobacteriia bacterium]|jgi:hypothetical protein